MSVVFEVKLVHNNTLLLRQAVWTRNIAYFQVRTKSEEGLDFDEGLSPPQAPRKTSIRRTSSASYAVRP